MLKVLRKKFTLKTAVHGSVNYIQVFNMFILVTKQPNMSVILML